MKKAIKMLQEQKEELLKSLNSPIKELGWEEVLITTERLERINNAISYLTRNYA